MNKPEILHVLVVLIVAFAVRLIFLSMVQMVTPDEAYYVQLSRSVAQGDAHTTEQSAYEGQPLYPLLCALAMKIGQDPVKTSQLVALFFAVMTIIPLHLCVRSFATSTDALWTDWLYALAPFTIQYSLWAMPHSLFNFFLMVSLLFGLKIQSFGNYRWAVLMGVAVVCAYLSRPEGFALALALCILIPILRVDKKRRRFFLALAFVSSICVVSMPFWITVWKTTHAWQIVCTATGGGVGGVFLSRFGDHWATSSFLTSLTAVYIKNLSTAYTLLLRIIPLLLWFLIAFGVASVLQRKQVSIRVLLLIFFFASFPLFFYPLYLVEARHLYPGLMVLLMFAGIGIYGLQRYLISCFSHPVKPNVAAALCLAVLLLAFIPGYRSLVLGFGEEPLEQKRLGEWIRQHVTLPQVILGTDRRSGFYAGWACKQFKNLQHVLLPATDRRIFETFLSENGIDLVVADTRYIPKFCPKFLFLLANHPSPVLKPLITMTEGSENITLYQVLKNAR